MKDWQQENIMVKYLSIIQPIIHLLKSGLQVFPSSYDLKDQMHLVWESSFN